MGVGMRVMPAFTEQLVIGIVNLWRDLGVLAADREIPAPNHMPLLANDHTVYWTSVTPGSRSKLNADAVLAELGLLPVKVDPI